MINIVSFFSLLAILRYIEASKARLYNSGGNSVASLAQAVLLYTFENILKVLHPFMPFVTEELWQVIVIYLGRMDTSLLVLVNDCKCII